MIEIEHIRKSYRGHTALHDLSLSIPDGRIFGLLGPNGAGKTTLLRLVMGVLRPEAGRITLFGGRAPGEPAVTRQIGYMPQQLALYEGLSVRENVVFLFEPDEAQELVNRMLKENLDKLLADVRVQDRALLTK